MLEPHPRRDASAWAEACRVLPPDAPIPGPWKASRAPYLIDIQAAFSDPALDIIVASMAAQLGKTECQFNVIGHTFDDGPRVPTLYVAPTQDLARSIAKDRITKMLMATPSLWRGVSRDRTFMTTLERWIWGVRLGFAWSGSDSSIASHPAGRVLFDEIDRAALQVTSQEGDPIHRTIARTRNYTGSKVGLFSSPTLDGISPVQVWWKRGTMERWEHCCPECDTWFHPLAMMLRWDQGCVTEREVHETARLECPACQFAFEDGPTFRRLTAWDEDPKKTRQRYQAHVLVKEEGSEELAEQRVDIRPRTNIRSFWVSGLSAFQADFGLMAQLLWSAYKTRNQDEIQAVLNTGFGETFKLSGQRPKWESVWRLRTAYTEEEIAEQVQFVTVGVDVQRESLYYAVRAWSWGMQSWLVPDGWGQIMGNTNHPDVWLRLSNEVLDVVYCGRAVDYAFIDSGFIVGKTWDRPEGLIKQFCRQRSDAYACKGMRTMSKPVSPSKDNVTVNGRVVKGVVPVQLINTDHFKSRLYERLAWPQDERGAWLVSMDVTEDYCRQVDNEELRVNSSGVRSWKTTGNDENHLMDCEVLNLAAAWVGGVHRLRDPALIAPKKKAPQRRGAFQRRGI